MSGYERLLQDITGNQRQKSATLGDHYHELRVALYKYTQGEITLAEYNAKIEEAMKFLESMKYGHK